MLKTSAVFFSELTCVLLCKKKKKRENPKPITCPQLSCKCNLRLSTHSHNHSTPLTCTSSTCQAATQHAECLPCSAWGCLDPAPWKTESQGDVRATWGEIKSVLWYHTMLWPLDGKHWADVNLPLQIYFKVSNGVTLYWKTLCQISF